MAESDASSEDRTESPSQYRREEFRRQGNVAMSKELLSVLVLTGVGFSLYMGSSIITSGFTELSHQYFGFGRITDYSRRDVVDSFRQVMKIWGGMVAPVFAAAMIFGILGSVAQVGFFVTWEPLSPNWDRLNPVQGFTRLFSLNSLMEAAKTLLKLGIASWIVWLYLKSHLHAPAELFYKPIPDLAHITLSLTAKLFFTLVMSLSVLAIGDYAFQRYRLEKQMRMTRQEAKEEFKLREGDPLMKSRIRSLQRKMASRRMMEAVPKADVVVTNPTHFAVALKYDSETMDAPRVIAKGADHVALKIKEIAKFHRVAIVENKPLARALYKELDIGDAIPRQLYKAVAEVLAYVYRLKAMAARAYA